MTAVEPFSRNMIKAFLDARGLKYLTDPDGDYLVRFIQEDERPCELELWFLAEGEKGDIFHLMARSNVRIERGRWGDSLVACNEWNKSFRWPKAYLQLDEEAGSGQVHLELQIALNTGIHQELLNDLAENMIAASDRFWVWAHTDRHLY